MSIERDMGASAASPNTIRFFVPYWISNDCSVPLTYRVVEIEPLDNEDVADSSKAAKSGKSSGFKNPPARRNIQVLEAIEDTSPIPSMFSPQDYIGQGGTNLFSTRNDACLSPRVGLAVATQHSENFSAGLSLLDLEKKVRRRHFNSIYYYLVANNSPSFLPYTAKSGCQSFLFRWNLLQSFSSTPHDIRQDEGKIQALVD